MIVNYEILNETGVRLGRRFSLVLILTTLPGAELVIIRTKNGRNLRILGADSASHILLIYKVIKYVAFRYRYM